MRDVVRAIRRRHDRTEREHGSNKVSAFFASLPTHLADPAARVFFLAEANRRSKDHHHEIDADMLQDWAQFSVATAGPGGGP